MGHYRSEMGYEDEDRKEAEHKAKLRAHSEIKIQKAIDDRGVASVLAEMIEDPLMFGLKYRHGKLES